MALPMALALEEAAAVRTDMIPIRLENIGLTLTLDQGQLHREGAKYRDARTHGYIYIYIIIYIYMCVCV